MKTQLQGWDTNRVTEKWNDHIGVYFTDDLELKIGKYRILAPLHYHAKDFVTDEMIQFLEGKTK
jgi:hypothetical protein